MKLIIKMKRKIQKLLYVLVRAASERADYWEMQKLRAKFKSIGTTSGFQTIGLVHGEEYISIGEGTTFGKEVYLTAWETKSKNTPHFSEIVIGKDCQFGAYNHITATNRIEIGDNCLTGKWVTITDNSHGYTNLDSLFIAPVNRSIVSKGPVIIGNNVWIGDKATILPNVRIGDGVVVAANAVVTHDVAAYCVVAGNPAKIVKHQ